MKCFSVVVISLIGFALGSGLLLGALTLGYGNSAVLIQSWESRTRQDLPVYNRIRWFKEGSFDIWMMNQSHLGVNAPQKNWDRLAIVVERSQFLNRARFYQLPPGELKWDQTLISKAKEYRVSCFLCHPNGPRVIRPDSASSLKLNWSDRLRLLAWNLKIKSYGRVITEKVAPLELAHKKVPFRFSGTFENSPLILKPCVSCHRDSGIFARGTLYRQNGIAIRSMIEKGIMPPLGFRLSPEEKNQIERFLIGF